MTRPVVVSPHLDDAVLSAFHVLQADRASRHSAVVLNVFCGVPPEGCLSLWDRLCGAESSAEQARSRILEDVRVLAPLGASVGYLGLSRSWYDALVRAELAADPPTPTEIADAVERELDSLDQPIYVPLAGGPRPHPDHRLVRDAGRVLAARGRSVWAYADFPYCAKGGGWPDWTGEIEGLTPRWLGRALRELPEIEALFAVRPVDLPDAQVAAKLAAARGYVTQFDALDKKLRERGLVSNVDLLRREYVWPLRARR